jgi:hypothetical protein
MDRADNASLTIVNPVAEPQAHEDDAERFAPAPRPSTLHGKTVALYWNGKQNGLDALDRTKQHLSKQFATCWRPRSTSRCARRRIVAVARRG